MSLVDALDLGVLEVVPQEHVAGCVAEQVVDVPAHKITETVLRGVGVEGLSRWSPRSVSWHCVQRILHVSHCFGIWMKQSRSFHASGCSDVPWTRVWSHVVEEMVDCSTPFQMRVKVTFPF